MTVKLLQASMPASAFRDVHHKIERFGMRCLKRGMPVPQLVELRRYFVPDHSRAVAGMTPDQLPQIEMVDVELAAPERISIGDWTLLGRVDRLPDGSPFVARVPGTEDIALPELERPDWCDHCRTERIRNETFLVTDPSGAVVQVGRNCLRDFLGHDPASLLWWIEAVGKISDDSLTWRTLGNADDYAYSTDQVLRLAARVAAHGGYLGREKARQINDERQLRGARADVEATADKVAWRIDPRPGAARSRSERDTIEARIADWDVQYPDDEAADRLLQLTKAALTELPDAASSEWERNVGQVASQPAVRPRHIGTAVSAVILGLRQQERAEKAASAAEPRRESRHIGAVGERLTLPATVAFIRHFDGDYGARTLFKLDAADGVLVWWASGAPRKDDGSDYAVGDPVSVRGTVKAHEIDRYDGRPVTVLSRCVLTPADAANAA